MSTARLLDLEREWAGENCDASTANDNYQAKNSRLRATLKNRCEFLNYLNRSGRYFLSCFKVEDLGIDLSSNEEITRWTLKNNRMIDRIREIEDAETKTGKR